MSVNFTTVDTFKYWCNKILPLVYDDSLSYYEQLCKVVTLLNQVIENVNNIPEYINEVISDDRLKVILANLLNEFREQIASADELDSSTATSDRVVGELVWLNGKLYRCIQQMDNGDRYVVDGNIEKVTIEGLIGDVRRFIATDEEVNQTNASRDIKAGELLWYKNVLIKCIKDIPQGTGYIEGTNYEVVTVESLLNAEQLARENADRALGVRIDNEASAREEADNALGVRIANEASAREEADNALGVRIDNEASAREEADNALGVRIDNEASAREEADNALETELNNVITTNLSKYKNIKTLTGEGGVDDNTTDNTSILKTIFSNIGSTECALFVDGGTYKISGSVTFPSNITLIFIGGKFQLDSGSSIIINGEINAPLYSIFNGSGNLVISATKNTVGYPEWVGNDLSRAIKLFQRVELQCKDYSITNDIVINKDNFALSGYSFSTYMTGTRRGSRIVESGGRIIVGDIAGRVINDFPRNITIENVEIVQVSNDTNPALSVYGVVYGSFKNLTISVSGQHAYGVYCTKNVSTVFDRCRVQTTNNTQTFRGFECTDENNPIAAGGNASLYFKYCTVSSTGTDSGVSYGWDIVGASSDVYLDHCESATVNIGLAISNSSGSDDANDIIITNCIFDACRNHGIIITNMTVPTGAISISNVYMSKDPSNNPNMAIFTIQNCSASIIAEGLQCIALNSNNIGIQLIGANGIFSGICNGMNTPYASANSTQVSVKYMHNGTLVNV